MNRYKYILDGEEGFIEAETGAKAFDALRLSHDKVPSSLLFVEEVTLNIHHAFIRRMESVICVIILKDLTPSTANQYTRAGLKKDAEVVLNKMLKVFPEYTYELSKIYINVAERIDRLVKE